MEYLEKNRRKTEWVRLKPEGLKWTPFLVTRGFGLGVEVGSTAIDGSVRKNQGGAAGGGGKADPDGGEGAVGDERGEDRRSPSLHGPEQFGNREGGGQDTFDYGHRRSIEPEEEEEGDQVDHDDQHVEIEDEEQDEEEEEEPLLLTTNSSSSDSDDGDGYSDTSSARRRRRRRSSRTRPVSTRPQRASVVRSTRAASTSNSTPHGNHPSSPRRALRGSKLPIEAEGGELTLKPTKVRKGLPARDSSGHFIRSTPKPVGARGGGGLGLDVISLVTGARRVDESMDVDEDD